VRTSNSGPWQDGGYLPWSFQDGQELELWKGSQAFTIHRTPPLRHRAGARTGDRQYTLVDSIATERIPHCRSQSASAFGSRVKEGKLRTGWGSRSALTATNNSLALTSMPAACGCKMGNSSHRLLDLFAIGSSEDRPDAQGANQKQTPNRDRRQS
jgi:hypothetical protein